MLNLAKKNTKPEAKNSSLKSKNGLQNLVLYYQKLFDIKENVDHYSPEDYQNAKRIFVKYLLEKRAM